MKHGAAVRVLVSTATIGLEFASWVLSAGRVLEDLGRGDFSAGSCHDSRGACAAWRSQGKNTNLKNYEKVKTEKH
jgi:hypothetical protein